MHGQWSVTSEERCGQNVHKEQRGRRGRMIVERCVREEENSLGFYVANSEENLRGVAAAEKINTEDTVTSGEFRKQKAK